MRGEFTIKYLKKYYLILLFGIVVAFWFTSRYNQILYILKHTVTFIFLALLSIKLTLYIFKKNLYENHEEFETKHYRLFRILTILSIVVSLTIISVVQRDYILVAETPPMETCYYYDEFGNYIHGSRLIYNCPTPVVEKTDDSLSMTFDYTYHGSGNGYSNLSIGGISLYENRKVEIGASRISVEVHYTDDNIIDYYRLREVTNYLADDYTRTEINRKQEYNLANQTYITNYYEVIINTSFDNGVIIQNKKDYQLLNTENIVESVTDFVFKDFSTSNPNHEREYRINYTSVSQGVNEFLLYEYTPETGYDEDNPIYEGVVEPTFDGTRLYFENEQTDYGSLEFSSKMYAYTTNSHTNSSSFVLKYYWSIRKYDYTNMSDTPFLPVLTKEKVMGLENQQSEDDLQLSFQSYNDFVYFQSQYKNNLLYKTDYGYRVETYGHDGVRDDSELKNHIGEIQYININSDNRIISLSGNTNFFYQNAPIFDMNSMMKYLLSLNSI